MPTLNAEMEIFQTIAQLYQRVEEKLPQWLNLWTPEDFLAMEEAAHDLGRALADGLTAVIVRQRLQDPELTAHCVSRAQQTGQYKPNGSRSAKVTLLGGSSIEVRTAYMPPTARGRSKGRVGVWPVLAALGIWWRTTPALCSEVNRQVADSNSFRDALTSLKRRGIDLEYKRALTLVHRFGRRAVDQRRDWLEYILAPSTPAGAGKLTGMTVLVSVDGGRVRQRRVKRGRRRASGHHGYHTPWREPRLLVISVLDPCGRIKRDILPIYDATLDDADGMMRLLTGYLKALGVHEARRLVVAADGAPWIWNRLPGLYEVIGIDRDKVFEVIDWSHAVGTLHDIAKECRWNETKRNKWVKAVKDDLFAGRIDGVLYSIKQLARGRRAKAILSHADYFDRNRSRMQYRGLKDLGLPRGSGIVESAIRRVINLRIKSPGKFWAEDNAEAALHLRSYLKAGHWDQLVHRTLHYAVPWNEGHPGFMPDMARSA